MTSKETQELEQLPKPIKTPIDLARELKCEFVIQDTSQVKNCVLNKLPGTLDWSSNILLVDFSYLTFSRFFAMRTWYSMAHKTTFANLAKDYNWCQDVVFMEKYTKTYMKKLIDFCKLHKIPRSNIIYVLDCRHNDNWRVQSARGYKGTRAESHEKNDFYNFDIFGYTRKVILTQEQATYGSPVFFHPNLEADDILALLVKHINTTCSSRFNFRSDIYIMANDRDYVQLCESNVYLYDISFKPISSDILGTNLSAQDFLLKKILLGDISDNIENCYIAKEFLVKHGLTCARQYVACTPKLIGQLLDNPGARAELYLLLESCRALLATLPEPEYDANNIGPDEESQEPTNHIILPAHESGKIFKDNQFLYNTRIIDFENIPKSLTAYMYDIFNTLWAGPAIPAPATPAPATPAPATPAN